MLRVLVLSVLAGPSDCRTGVQVEDWEPGRSAAEVEAQATAPLEEALARTPGVVSLRSESRNDGALIDVSMTLGTDPMTGVNVVGDSVAAVAKRHVPAPYAATGRAPGAALRFVIGSPTLDLATLGDAVPQLFRSAPGPHPDVVTVNLCGGQQEIGVELDGRKLATFGQTGALRALRRSRLAQHRRARPSAA